MFNKKNHRLSIVIPILNEAKNINILIPKIVNCIKNKIKKHEIIIVDDDSDDNIGKIIFKLKKKYKFIKFVQRKGKTKRDLSQSCLSGFKKAKYENILVMDGDLQHDPKYIIKLYRVLINKKLDMAIGSRNLIKNGRKGLSLIRYLASILIIFIFNFFLGKKTADPMTGYFIFKKKILNQGYNKLYGKGFKILSDIIYSTNNDYKIEDVDINFKLRKKGGSKMNTKILLQIIIFFFNKLLKNIFI